MVPPLNYKKGMTKSRMPETIAEGLSEIVALRTLFIPGIKQVLKERGPSE